MMQAVPCTLDSAWVGLATPRGGPHATEGSAQARGAGPAGYAAGCQPRGPPCPAHRGLGAVASAAVATACGMASQLRRHACRHCGGRTARVVTSVQAVPLVQEQLQEVGPLVQQPQEQVPDGRRALTYRPLPLWPGQVDVSQEFGGLKIPKILKNALEERGIFNPSGIQGSAMPTLAEGKSVIVHAPTGSGKTLAYLLPMLARLQPTMHLGMQVLILMPSAKLAVQIFRELRWLIDVLCPEGVCWFNPHIPKELGCEILLSRKSLWDAITKDTAVIVSTPSLITAEIDNLKWENKVYAETLSYFMCSNLQCIVMDEADELLRRRELPPPAYLLVEYCFDVIRHRYRNHPVQMICGSATVNSGRLMPGLQMLLEGKWRKRRDAARRQMPILIQDGGRLDAARDSPKAREVRNSTHVVVPPNITHTYAVIEEDENADRFLMVRKRAIARLAAKLEGTVLLFLPEEVKLGDMLAVLREGGVTHALPYRLQQQNSPDFFEIDQKRKKKKLPQGKGPSVQTVLEEGQKLIDRLAAGEKCLLVVKTSEGRGIDLPNVRYCINFRMPFRPKEYQHLAGRTGRMGAEGTVINFMTLDEIRLLCGRMEGILDIDFKEWDLDALRVKDPRPIEHLALPEERREKVWKPRPKRHAGKRPPRRPKWRYDD